MNLDLSLIFRQGAKVGFIGGSEVGHLKPSISATYSDRNCGRQGKSRTSRIFTVQL